LRDTLTKLDSQMLGECRALFTNARNTASRLAKFNGLSAEPLYHPPKLASRLVGGPYTDYVLSVGRLEAVKRVDLIIAAMAQVPSQIRLVVAGDGTQRQNAERTAEQAGVADRVTFLGNVGDDQLVELYARALAVVYPPYDEDFGYVTLEAFLARKPVITCVDSGGPNEFVIDDVNGFVCAPNPDELASAMNRLAATPAKAAALGDAGREVATTITWDGVIEKLTTLR
jgi:glycosyltransferase involved in cell wall biosynthesis